MKILQISSAPVEYTGGTERVVWEISKRLVKNNKVTILQTTLYDPRRTEGRIVREGVEIITCKNDLFLGGYGFSKSFKKVLKKVWKNYDLVHIHGYGRFTSDFSLKFLNEKKPIIFTAHGFFHHYSLPKKLHDIIKGRLIRNANFCTALTKLDEGQYKKRGVSKRKIRLVPNGVEIKRFGKRISKQLKQKYTDGNKTLLYLGGISESKGLQYVIEAIKDLDTRLLIVGKDRGYKKQLKEIISKLRLKNKVKFLGSPDDREVNKIFSACDVFVLFSEWEGFGLVVIEAMASGKPVIGSDRGAIPYLIKDAKTGFVVPYKNVKILRRKIETLILDDKKRTKMGKEAKKFSKGYSWGKIIKEYEKVYNEVLTKV